MEPDNLCETGAPVRCGDSLRLEHVETKANLHSHEISSPISGKYEVTGFGEDGEGDSGDNWIIECIDSATGLAKKDSKDILMGSSTFQLRHINTKGVLMCEKKNDYNNRNCARCPIIGQLEASTQLRGISKNT